jgi:hypothetical protein
MFAGSAILLSWAFSAVCAEASACWPSEPPASCEPAPETTSPPASGAPVSPSPAKAPGQSRDPEAAPTGSFDDGLPATWEPLEIEDGSLEALGDLALIRSPA